MTNASCSERPRMWVSGSTSSMPAVDHLLDDVLRRQRAEGVVDGLRPGVHLLRLAAGQVAEVLAAHGVQRAEDHDLAVLAALEHRLEAGAERQRGLAGAGPTAEGDDADLGVEQQVERDPLFGAAAVQTERVAVAADQPDRLVRRDPAQPAAAVGDAAPAPCGRAGRGPARGRRRRPRTAGRDRLAGHVELGHAGPAGLDDARSARYSSACSPTADALTRSGRSFETSVTARPRRRGCGDGEDPGVVVAEPEPGRQHVVVGVVELDPHRAALFARPGAAASRRPCCTRRSSSSRSAAGRSSRARGGGACPPAR